MQVSEGDSSLDIGIHDNIIVESAFSNLHLLSVHDIGLVKRLKALKDARSVELCLRNRESLLRSQKHVEFASWAIVHANRCMNITGNCKLLLDKELRYGLCPLKVEHNLLLLFLLSPDMSAVRLRTCT